MKKIITIIALIVVLLGGFYAYTTMHKKDVAPTSSTDYKSTPFMIDGQKVTLINGVAEVESAPGSSSKTTTTYFGNEIKKDLNGDGAEDVAFLVTQNTGGSGTFFYVVGAVSLENGYVGTEAVLLGDRIAPQTTESGPGKSIIVNYMERAPSDPMTAQPSVGKSLRLLLDAKTLQFGEVAQNFEGEADPSRMSLTMKTWKWEKTQYNDGKTVEPKKDVFTLTFKDNGTFSATTDCNTVGGRYVATSQKITFDKMISTLMYCDGSQEGDFRKALENTGEYLFTSKGELVLSLKLDSGSVYFK